MENTYFHSVVTHPKSCKGCTNCIKFCPMEAIRIRNHKAVITSERCIDCGQCIRHCPYRSMRFLQDSMDILNERKYNVALVSMPLFGQFKNLDDPDFVLTALLNLGFDDVAEVSLGSEIYAKEARKYINANKNRWPYINTTCPAIVRLVRMRFPSLVEHLLPIRPPMEIMAASALKKAMDKTGLKSEDIGIIHIAACPAQVAYTTEPLGLKKSNITGSISIKTIYPKLVIQMNALMKDGTKKLSAGSAKGFGARASGVNSELIHEDFFEATDIKSIIGILEGMENDEYREFPFLDLYMCEGGCLNGELCVQNHYVARAALRRVTRHMTNEIPPNELPYVPDVFWNQRILFKNVYQLGESLKDSISMLAEIKDMEREFPGLDCGACGAPTCKALAEDVVRKQAYRQDCIYYTRKQIHELTKEIDEYSEELSRSLMNGELTDEQISKLQEFINRLWMETSALDESFNK